MTGGYAARVSDFVITPVGVGDAGEIFTLQRAAFVSEAQLYGRADIPTLTQTLDELTGELASNLAVKATLGHRIVGAGRARPDGTTLHIGRLIVAPDQQGRGIGTRLLTALEDLAPPATRTFALFTGHLSVGNLRLYERLGYVEAGREAMGPGVTRVHLTKGR